MTAAEKEKKDEIEYMVRMMKRNRRTNIFMFSILLVPMIYVPVHYYYVHDLLWKEYRDPYVKLPHQGRKPRRYPSEGDSNSNSSSSNINSILECVLPSWLHSWISESSADSIHLAVDNNNNNKSVSDNTSDIPVAALSPLWLRTGEQSRWGLDRSTHPSKDIDVSKRESNSGKI
eukprot:Tbor_TRINITY_DN5480_c1_g1::TRINITY_DN5480_c1_g1_i1::g.25177::m.25177